MNEQLYNVSANPHVRDKASTHSIMLDVIIALLPATLFGFWNFGVKAIINTVICVAVCVLAEYVWQRCMHQKITIKDCSAALTGLLLALNLPPEVPFWIPVIGGLFAIIVVKQLFGGLGQNFMNPALGARCFLLISFAGIMTNTCSEATNIGYYIPCRLCFGYLSKFRIYFWRNLREVSDSCGIPRLLSSSPNLSN